MKIASFNINGVKARLPALLDWLRTAAPDVAVLQEIKSVDENFPREPIEDLGYNLETHGQKGFNGVAILSKRPLEDVSRGLPGDPDDEQARWIEATVSGDEAAVRVCGRRGYCFGRSMDIPGRSRGGSCSSREGIWPSARCPSCRTNPHRRGSVRSIGAPSGISVRW